MNMRGKKYTHVKRAERVEVAFLLNKGYGISDIARALKRSKGTLSDEIRKNSVNGKYDPDKADQKAYVKRKYSKYQGMRVENDKNLRNYVENKLKDDWSPEQIAGRINKKDKHIKYASRTAIYKFIYSPYGRNLEKYLVYKGKSRKPKTAQKTEQIKDRVFIDKRPKMIDKRRRFGDWEGDFIVSGKSGKGAILTLYERKSKYCILKKFVVQKIELIHQYIFEITGGVVVNSLTLDNDIVFKKHKALSVLLGRPIYFCHPYHSWEKGGVENTNKLIRRYIPKGSDISQYRDEYIKMIQDKLNNRPRKCLKYKTPYEIMAENNQFKKEIKYLLSDIIKIEENKKAECSA